MQNRDIFKITEGTSRNIYFPTALEIRQSEYHKNNGIPQFLYSTEELDYLSLKKGMTAYYMFGSMKNNNPKEYEFLNTLPGQSIFDRYEYFSSIFLPILQDELTELLSKLMRDSTSFIGFKKIQKEFEINSESITYFINNSISLVSSAMKFRDVYLFAKDDDYISKLK